MLQLKNISKIYKTGDFFQIAINDLSLDLRDNEFVSILGPSGSGKTTLLNIIGGLDRYDSGDLIINNKSTKQYKDREWDSYRNHTIGFVFQSYNLIPHQSVLANVELALTISGISKAERRKKAKDALIRVGLEEHISKRPNQLSGGQMQRVAIARALVNDPDILLADEPTGALDSETSLQVMQLLKEVATDRLVIMVTHNPELAENYSTRIVKLKDGKIESDSNPFVAETKEAPSLISKIKKASMSFLTSLQLSANNLRTKKGRTFMTSFAGSIGIIGIALILSLSSGVNKYIEDIQKTTMMSYPITINERAIDLTSIINTRRDSIQKTPDHDFDKVYSDPSGVQLAQAASISITTNNLSDFKKYLDDPNSEIHKYLGSNGIVYSYNLKYDLFTKDPTGKTIDTDGVNIEIGGMSGSSSSFMARMASLSSPTSFSSSMSEILPGKDTLISSAVTDNYDLLYGEWPSEYDQIVLVLDKNNELGLVKLYELGMLPADDYNDLINKLTNAEEIEYSDLSWDYSAFLEKDYYLVPACDRYEKDEDGLFVHLDNQPDNIEKLVDGSIKLKISGIVKLKQDKDSHFITTTLAYTKKLTDHLIKYTDQSLIVSAQKENRGISVLTGLRFDPDTDEEKVEDTKAFLSKLNVSEKATFFKIIAPQVYASEPEKMGAALRSPESVQAESLDEFIEKDLVSVETYLLIYGRYVSSGTYDGNMSDFGLISVNAPSSINIYTDTFENKDKIAECINRYNETTIEENKISYTDYVGLLMSSVTTIINVVSYVLIAFVSVSLVVSSIMIGIITYISVLERTKEIGILRALGASKRNISSVFNAETLIIGFISGLIGIIVTLLLLIPINAIIHHFAQTNIVNAYLPPVAAITLIILSMILTFIGGLIPSKAAAKKDPVIALRTE